MTDPRPEWVETVHGVLVSEGADSEGGWHSWRCFDLTRYPESCDCTENAARAALDAVAPLIAAQALREAAEEFWARLPDGTGNGRAYNSHRVADMLRARADQTTGADA